MDDSGLEVEGDEDWRVSVDGLPHPGPHFHYPAWPAVTSTVRGTLSKLASNIEFMEKPMWYKLEVLFQHLLILHADKRQE